MTQATEGKRRARRTFGAVRRLPSGRYQAHWTGPDGYKHYGPATWPSAAEADLWLAGQHVELASGVHVDERDAGVTLEAFAGEWKATIVHLARSSMVRDLGYLERYILPELGRLTLGELDYTKVAGWVSAMRAEGLAPATIVKAAQILGKILDTAIKAGKLRANPVRGVKLPKVKRSKVRGLYPPEVDRLAEAIDPRYRDLVIVGCYTALRPGELFALTAGDVDLLRRRITVRRNVVDLGELELSTVKTDAGHRFVPLSAEALEVLERLAVGRHPDDLLFEAPKGGFIRLNGWRQRFWNPAVRAAGLAPLTPHDMRHTGVSIWLRAGIDPKAVAQWAGHRSVATVLDTYAHELPDHAESALARLDAYVSESKARAPRPATITPIRPGRAGAPTR